MVGISEFQKKKTERRRDFEKTGNDLYDIFDLKFRMKKRLMSKGPAQGTYA